MKKCIIIGGGFAGLSAGVYLSNANFQVEILEASPKLGGRAFSFTESHTKTVIDNGQHILMGCYIETLDFFKTIQADNNLIFQKRLKVCLLKENFEEHFLKAFPLPYPFDLLFGLLNYSAIPFADRIKIIKLFLKLFFKHQGELNSLSIYDWLVKENQNENTIETLWKILAVGVLNTNMHKASAKIFVDVLKKIFFNGKKSSIIIIPKYGLSETYCTSAKEYIESCGGNINLTEEVKELIVDNEKIKTIKTNKRSLNNFDYIISSVPQYALSKILPHGYNFYELYFEYSSILSVHIWLRENPLEHDFYGLIKSPVQWIFNNGSHITLVISDANKYADYTKEEIITLAVSELDKYMHIKKRNITFHKIIREKRATFIPTNEIINNRPKVETPISNLLLAGDWTDTGLPSTIESAVKSGKRAAEKIMSYESV
ncbi:MAG TPA: hypothetical protein ENI61_02170 [Ignavibacteria bacterium]|mgnify:CR=1 FL=1|nr:hypothetical protein [Ignavibacteria bacterium]